MNPYRDAITAVVIAAAWADGEVDDLEKQALDRVFTRLGYSRAETTHRIGEALKGPSTDQIELPVDQAMAQEVMRYVLAVTLADGDLSSKEVEFLVMLAGHLKLSSDTLSALKNEAEGLVGQREAARPATGFERVDALMPDHKVKLSTVDAVEHLPSERERYTAPGDAVPSEHEGRLLYEGDKFGGELEL